MVSANQNWKFPRKKILVDFDGTLGPFAWPGVPKWPFPDVAVGLKRLKSLGFSIWIFTTRAWPGWAEIDGREFYDKTMADMKSWLDTWGIPYDGITWEKLPAKYIVDDRSLNPNLTPWPQIIEIIAGSEDDPYGKSRMMPDAERP